MRKLLGVTMVLLLLSCGCAGGGYYQTSDQYVPYITDVPPSFYDGDPTLRHWFTAPYWDPSSKGE
jgi:hypothetical protein